MEQAPLPPLSPRPEPSRGGRLRKLFSPARLKDALADVAARFPLTLVFVCLLTIYALAFIWDFRLPDTASVATTISLSLGAMMTLAASLWCECFGAGRRRSAAVQTGVLILVVANFAWLMWRGMRLDFVDGVGYAAAYTALAVAIGFVPAMHRCPRRVVWFYTVGVFEAVAMGLLLACVFICFCSLVLGTVDLLFGLYDNRIWATMSILLAGLLPAVAMLCRMPRMESLESEPDDAVGARLGIAVFAKNVLLPLAVAYMAILYVYALKILISFSLPNGSVCWMVIGLVSAVLLIIYGLQGFMCCPDVKEPTRRLAALALRWLPLLQVPLLVLMSVAIFYRIEQYGVTPSRLYVAAFNIWAYLVVAYLSLRRRPRLNVVATSFALIFLLTSVVPRFNFCTWGIEAVRSKVRTELLGAGARQLPLSYDGLISLINTLPREQAESLAGDLGWLDDWDNHSAVGDLVRSDETLRSWSILQKYEAKSGNDKGLEIDLTTSPDDLLSPVPEGFASLSFHRRYSHDNFTADSAGFYSLTMNAGFSLRVPVDSLSRLDADGRLSPVRVEVDGAPDDAFYITDISITGVRGEERKYSFIRVGGYLFTKESTGKKY